MTDHSAEQQGTPDPDASDLAATAAAAAREATSDRPDSNPDDTSDEPRDANSKAGKDAARYRRQLRDTEAQRDQLTEQLTTLRKQVVEGASGLQQPSALWLSGVDVSTLFDNEGRMDASKVADAVAAAAHQLGLAKASRTPRPDPSQGHGGHRAGRGRRWADLIKDTD